MIDLAIRNGLLVDGTGMPAYRGDLSVRDGRIVAVGGIASPAHTEIDASGLVVCPGFVDPHTHFDAQLLFDPFATPLMEHGVTTVVTGNCSLSMAPLRASQREQFQGMFRLIEEMPQEAFDEGVDWRWGEDFGAMLEVLREDLAMNVAPLVGHSVLRLFVMGDAAQARAASPDEIAQMAQVLHRCLEAGAAGLSTSYIDIDPGFQPVPSRWAQHAELDALCAVLGQHGRMLQIVHEFFDPELTVSRIEMLTDLSLRHGIATTLSPLFHSTAMPQSAERIMDAIDRAWDAGARVWPQVQTRPIDISFTLARRSTMFLTIPGWWEVASLPDHASKVAAFSDPSTRERLVAAANALASTAGLNMDPAGFIVREVVHERNRDLLGRTLGDIAAERRTTAGDALIDLALEEDLGTWFLRANLGHTDETGVGELLRHPRVHIGASDAGAHIGTFATYGDTGYLFSRFVRGTGHLRLEEAVKKVTLDPCTIWSIPDRGALRSGFAADVTVFDPATIDRGPEFVANDFPGGMRWSRRSEGVETVVVGGEVTWSRAGGYTAARRGQIVNS
jgi:N-acyl-D-aspartate/D-glutamate deacylase